MKFVSTQALLELLSNLSDILPMNIQAFCLGPELFAVNGPYLLASMGLKLLPKLPYIGEGGEPMHLAVITPIHLVTANASLDLHVLESFQRSSCCEKNKCG